MGHRPGRARVFHSEDALGGQLKLKWIQVKVFRGFLHKGCLGRLAVAKAERASGLRALYARDVLASHLKSKLCGPGVFWGALCYLVPMTVVRADQRYPMVLRAGVVLVGRQGQDGHPGPRRL